MQLLQSSEKKPRPRLAWRLRSDFVSDDCFLKTGIDVETIAKETGLTTLTVKVCLLRGLKTPQEILEYLHPRLDKIINPFSILDMDIAAERLIRAKESGDIVRVFSDYDVDGTTSAALLTWFFRDLGFNFDVRQPDRMRDGYGLNIDAVEEAAKDGVGVLLTVDCGITNFKAIERAKHFGMDLIVVDHHQVDPEKGIPKAFAVIDPQRKDCTSGLNQLCGCGLAFYLCIALRQIAREKGWFENREEPNLKQHLDLVALATAADQVPLVGDNRILVSHGLDTLKNSSKPGIKALFGVSGVAQEELSCWHLAFILGPRINASGRMGSAGLALELLSTHDHGRALELAREIEKLNRERMNVQNKIWDEVRDRIDSGMTTGRYKNAIVVADKGWHEGVIGIVASKVVETYHRPAIVITIKEAGGAKGSVRTFAGKDVLMGLRKCSGVLNRFGGHKAAAGIEIEPHKILELENEFDRVMGQVSGEEQEKVLLIEGNVTLEELDIKTLEEIEKLGPFGPGNPEPVFSLKAGVRSGTVIKDRHMKLNLYTNGCDEKNNGLLTDVLGAQMQKKANCNIEAIWFNAAEKQEYSIKELSVKETYWAGVPVLNRFRGYKTPTFRIRDWRETSIDG